MGVIAPSTEISLLGELSTVTTKWIRDKVPDQLRRANYLYNLLVEKNKVRIKGGSEISFPFKGRANSSSAVNINGTSDIIALNVEQQLYDAKFPWIYKATSVTFTLDEFNRIYESPDAIVDYVAVKKNGAMSDAVRSFTQDLYNSRTTGDPKGFNGMADIFAASGTAYGGYADTDFTGDVWSPVIDTNNNNITYTIVSSMISQLKARTQGAYAQSNRFGDNLNVDTMLSNYFLFQNFKITEQAKQRFDTVRVTDAKDVSIGWDAFNVDGVKWFIDEFAQGSKSASFDNYLYVLSSASFMLYYKYGFDKKSPFDNEKIDIPNMTITGSKEFFSGALVNVSRRANGVFKNLK